MKGSGPLLSLLSLICLCILSLTQPKTLLNPRNFCFKLRTYSRFPHLTCFPARSPFCRAQADSVLRPFTTSAPGTSLRSTPKDFTRSVWMSLGKALPQTRNILSVLPLQVGSVGVWVDSLFQVVAEVHQHLLQTRAVSSKLSRSRR